MFCIFHLITCLNVSPYAHMDKWVHMEDGVHVWILEMMKKVLKQLENAFCLTNHFHSFKETTDGCMLYSYFTHPLLSCKSISKEQFFENYQLQGHADIPMLLFAYNFLLY